MKRTISFFMLVVFIMVMLPGCSILQKLGLQEGPDDELRPVSSILIGEVEASQLTDKTPIRLYFANEDNTRLKLEIRYVDYTEEDKNAAALATVIVNELIRGPSDDVSLKRTVPAEAKLKSPVSINGKVATVNMSKEFKTKHPGGKDAEKMTIYSIVNSLTELPEIEKVKFTIDGKTQKEYMGNFKFDSLFPRSAQIISKESGTSAIGSNEQDSAKKDDKDNKETVPLPGTNKPADSKPTSTDLEISGQTGELMEEFEVLE